jgi:hypothetical protein
MERGASRDQYGNAGLSVYETFEEETRFLQMLGLLEEKAHWPFYQALQVGKDERSRATPLADEALLAVHE